MKTYETPEGLVIGIDGAPLYARAMHADLVAALEIARAYQAKCEQLEAMLENAGDLAHNLQEEGDALRAQVLRLRAEVNRLELVS